MSFLDTVKACWALFLSFCVMVLGHGLIGSLVGVRLTLEGYPASTSGLVLAGFFVGIVLAALLAPRLIQRVGHIRVFAAMSALAGLAALAHAVWVEAVFWFLLRALGGFASTSMYIVVESWVNDRARNEFRGLLLSVYMVVWLLSMSGGQLLIDTADPGGPWLFLLAGALFSLSVVPLALATQDAPDYSRPQPVSMRRLYHISRLGAVGAFLVGMTHGTLVGMASVYAKSSGLAVSQVAVLTAAIYWGGMLLQFPLGRLSDLWDRRLVLAGVALAAAVVSIAAFFLAEVSYWALVGAIGLFGGLALPLYALCLAIANDRMSQAEMVGASATLYLLVGLGAAAGPPAAGFLMQALGPGGYFIYLAAVLTLLGLYAVWRRQQNPLPSELGTATPALPPLEPPGGGEPQRGSSTV